MVVGFVSQRALKRAAASGIGEGGEVSGPLSPRTCSRIRQALPFPSHLQQQLAHHLRMARRSGQVKGRPLL